MNKARARTEIKDYIDVYEKKKGDQKENFQSTMIIKHLHYSAFS